MKVVVYSFESFADPINAQPLLLATGGLNAPVTHSSIPSATMSRLQGVKATEVVVVGGPSAVSDAVVNSIQSIVGGTVRRLSGADRYGTAALVAAYLGSSTIPPNPIPPNPPTAGPVTLDADLGNSGVPTGAMPHSVDGGTVDGTRIGMCARWVESGYCASVWDGGVLQGQFGDLISWGRAGGIAMAISGDFAFVSMYQDTTAGQGQAGGAASFGIRRYSISASDDSPCFSPGAPHGVRGSIVWVGSEPTQMVVSGGVLHWWDVSGYQGAFTLALVPTTATPPSRPSQLPAGVTIDGSNTPVLVQAGHTLYGSCFVDNAINDPANENRIYTAKHIYNINRMTGAWDYVDCTVVNGAADPRWSGTSGHPAVTPIRKVGNLLFVSGMNGELRVIDLTTKAVIGSVSVPWGYDVDATGQVWSVEDNGVVKKRTSWSAGQTTVTTLSGLTHYERIVCCDDGRFVVGGWLGTRPGSDTDPWGMVGDRARLYTSAFSLVWTISLPWASLTAPYDGPKGIATAGNYMVTTDLGRDNQPTNRVYRLSDGGLQTSWKPNTPHGWMDCINGIKMHKLADGRYRFWVEDDGTARVRRYERTLP